MTLDEVSAQYEARLRNLEHQFARARFRVWLAALLAVIAAGLVVALGFLALQAQLSWVWTLVPIPFAAVGARLYAKQRDARYRLWRLSSFYERAVQRVQGNWACRGVTGEEFAPPDHVYAKDLNVFGEGSLFELLCVARTSIGRQGLASYLLEPCSAEEAMLRQQAVRELTGRVDLRERLATLGELEAAESNLSTFEDWLSSEPFRFPRPLAVVTMVTSSALLAAAIVVLLTGQSFLNRLEPWVLPLVAFHTAIGLVYRERVNRTHDLLRPVAAELPVLREGLGLLETQDFQSIKLRQIVARLGSSSKSLRRLERLLLALNERHNPMLYALSLPLLAGTQLCAAIQRWRDTNGEALRGWMSVWAEFEALNALAAYAYENPDNTYPEFANGTACFEAIGMGHPLLPHHSCVANDVELKRGLQFLVLSGSNMAGKSTLLRAIGLNTTLAFAGAPVRARTLRLSSGLPVFASVSISDSLMSGKSRFQAEVERLRQAIECARGGKSVLFLVDEIFGGTNSRDRRIAAEAVVRTLVEHGAIGVLSTHDLALTEIASAEGLSGLNVHMGSRDGTDPMDFDYRLRPGITQESNALAIARMSGVPV